MLTPSLVLYRPDEDPIIFREVRCCAATLGFGELRAVTEIANAADDVPACLVARIDNVERAEELLEGIRECDRPLSVLFLAEKIRAEEVVALVRAGAWEILQRPLDRDRLRLALKTTAARAAIEYAKRCRALPIRRRLESLSPGEREVLRLILAGISNKRTAKVLGIAVRTVEARRCRIFSKLGTFSCAEITAMLITAEPSLATNILDLTALQKAVSSFPRAVRKRNRSGIKSPTRPSPGGATLVGSL